MCGNDINMIEMVSACSCASAASNRFLHLVGLKNQSQHARRTLRLFPGTYDLALVLGQPPEPATRDEM
jgi:hypothetical protein